MEKLLNPTAARNVFKGSAHDFLKKGGANYISAASLEPSDAQRFAVANLLAAKGNKCWSEMLTYCPEGETMMKNANKELLSGHNIVGAEMTAVAPEQAAKIVAKAEQQIENNQKALQISKDNLVR